VTDVERATTILKKLSQEKLSIALYFLDLLSLKEELEATEEVASDDELRKQLYLAAKARQENRTEEFVPWERRHEV